MAKSVGGLRVELRERGGRVTVVAVGSVEYGVVLLFASEPVVVLDRRTAYSLPGDVHVIAQLRHFLEPVIECRVLLYVLELLEVLVNVPEHYPLVLQRVRKREGLEYARGVLADAVLVGLYAVLAVHYAVAAMQKGRELLLVVVSLALLAAEPLVPFVEGNLRDFGGVLYVKGVKTGEFERVAGGEQSVTRVCTCGGVAQGDVVLELEWILEFKRIRNPDGVSRIYQQFFRAVRRCGEAVCSCDETVRLSGSVV